jgi:thiamine biosynthesis lipoprotein ApbE
LLVVAIALVPLKTEGDQHRFYHERVLGTSLELVVQCDNPFDAKQAESQALTEIDRLAAIFSSYDPASELSEFQRLQVGQSREISPELYSALRQSEQWWQLSNGAFHPAAELMTRRWLRAQQTDILPSRDELDADVQTLRQLPWTLHSQTRRAERTSTAPISLNAIAKGIVIEHVATNLLANHERIQGVLINIGGDLRLAGDICLPVAIADPFADSIGSAPLTKIELRNAAVATSGQSERSITVGQHRYSHIIDPRSGWPVVDTVSATVIADDAGTADALATICSVLRPSESLALIDSLPATACLLVTKSGEKLQSRAWPVEFDQTENSPRPWTAMQTEKASEQTPTGHTLTVDFEIAKPADAQRFRRPYVAVWVEDKDGYPVKTLSLFLMTNDPGPRWHRDLRRWHSDEQIRRLTEETELPPTTSKPTRGPGKYSVAWDGRDNTGKLLPPGKYTLLIEAAREHGTYQLIKHNFELGKNSFDETLKGNVEISAAKVKYVHKGR